MSIIISNINLIIAFIMGLILGIIGFWIIHNAQSKKLNAYKREIERKSINSTESSSRVDVLEAKIKVLEKALQDALNK